MLFWTKLDISCFLVVGPVEAHLVSVDFGAHLVICGDVLALITADKCRDLSVTCYYARSYTAFSYLAVNDYDLKYSSKPRKDKQQKYKK